MKAKILRVTITRDYIIPMRDDEKTHINGWTMDKVIEDWFERNSIHSYHATRDGHRIGNSEKMVDTEIIETIDLGDNEI